MFQSRTLTLEGQKEIKSLQHEIKPVVDKMLLMLPEGREKALFKHNLELALYFGMKSLAMKPGNSEEVPQTPQE
jgi:hypothetical protein